MLKIFLKRAWVFAFIALVFLSNRAVSQTQKFRVDFKWKTEHERTIRGVKYTPFLTLENGQINPDLLPVFVHSYPIKGPVNLKVTIEQPVYEALSSSALQRSELITGAEPVVEQAFAIERKNPQVAIRIKPFRKVGGRLERLVSCQLAVSGEAAKTNQVLGKKAFGNISVLASGEWYKINVKTTGIQRLNKAFLKNLGIDIDNLDPRTIRIYGNGAGYLPGSNKAPRVDDLAENAIVVNGESDGVFNDNDEVLFFGRAQTDVWDYDKTSNSYYHRRNLYADVTTFFLTVGSGAGKRVTSVASPAPNQTNDGHYDFLFVHDYERVNLIRSGNRWVGEEFNHDLTQSFNVNLENADGTLPVFIRSGVAARAFVPSTFSLKVNGQSLMSQLISQTNPDFESAYAFDNFQTGLANPAANGLTLEYTYNQPAPGALGWLDLFEVQSRNFLSVNKPQFTFRDKNSIGAGKVTTFNVGGSANVKIWDVTEPYNATQLQTSFAANVHTFSIATDTLREFIAFDGSSFVTPEAGGKVANQNIHGLPNADMLIVTHELFASEANRLAEYHRGKGLVVHVVPISQVYNEFSSGVQDITGIRDMARMFYLRSGANQLKYLLLFGRASYDYKNRVTSNTNFVPTFESYISFDPITSYCSDDYFGLLDDNEGNMFDTEKMDIAIGRIPATLPENAAIMVNKILGYMTNPDRNDWLNRLTFVADDEDGNLHQNQSNVLADNARNKFKNYNVQKIFLDAFKEVTTAGGARNPDAQAEIVRAVERGCMLVNYTGHGGEVGWAAERVLNTADIQGWTNGRKLPLFFTATCEFSRFDDPARFSAGEYVLLNANGGGIALMTTVRLVDAFNNNALNTAFYRYAGFDSAAAFNRMTIGEIMRLTKNDVPDQNTRNFTLLGDPAMMLHYPEHRVQTTLVDNKPVGSYNDTLKAFSKVTVSGRIVDIYGAPVTNYNGIVYPTFFDKVTNYSTVVNNPDHSSPANFLMQNNVIYRGSASVVNGEFSFSFIVPKDIGYQVGLGRISYYADDGTHDAHGYDTSLKVGGTSDSIGVDLAGPEIKLYLNNENFAFGGLTDENPLFIAKLHDLTGINITGVGIGRNLALTLNNDNTTTVSMNDFYRSKTDSYQDGEVRYQMKSVPAGKNTVKLTAWDVYNNYSESVLEFIVASSAEMAIQHVLNYPNPFTTHTTFHFDHNKPDEHIKVQVQIFSVSGKLVKTLQSDTYASGSHFDQLSWDGRDEYGDQIGKGVYVYKVKVKSDQGKSAEEYQKLVILN